MRQLFGKHALVALSVATALLFTARPAQAQTPTETNPVVAASGVGDHLIFSYWTAERNMETLLSITSPLGHRRGRESRNVVRVSIADAAGTVQTSFRICLEGSDAWTAVLKKASADDEHGWVVVRDPGECDGDIVQPGATTAGLVATPMPDDPVMISRTHMGLIHAFTDPEGTLIDGDSPNDETDNATPRRIIGQAHLLSPKDGFSSTYTATALVAATDPAAADGGCGTGLLNVLNLEEPEGDPVADYTISTSWGQCTMAQVHNALVVEDKEVVFGRWSALSDENVHTKTDVVVTFPGTNHLKYPSNAVGEEGTPVQSAADPVSLFVFDDEGTLVASSGAVELDKAVNMCSFGMDMDMMDMGDDMDMMDMMDMGDDMDMPMMVMCNGTTVIDDLMDASGGVFRLFNQNAAMVHDTRTTEVSDLGTEGSGPTSGGQVVDETLQVTGLVLTFFKGTDYKLYDQAAMLQWIGNGTVTDYTTATDGDPTVADPDPTNANQGDASGDL